MAYSMDKIVNGLAAAPVIPVYKNSQTTKGIGLFHSLWTVNGFPAAGAAAGSVNGAIPTKATTGALNFVDAAGGENTFLAQLSLQSSVIGTFIVYDRLWHNSALNGTLATAQTFTQPALTRHTDGIGVEIWLEWYTATGSTAVTATISYTNSDNVAGRSATCAIAASPVAGQMMLASLQTGDKGVKSVQSVTLSATTGTAGNFGVTLVKRKAHCALNSANIASVQDFAMLGLPEVQDNACLAFSVHCTTTNTGQMAGLTNVISMAA